MCDERRETLVHAYADGELDAPGSLEMEQHLHECVTCTKLYESVLGLRGALRSSGVYFTAPSYLAVKCRRTVGLNGNSAAQADNSSKRQVSATRWLAIAAVFVVGCAIGTLYPRQTYRSGTDIADEAVEGHVRSLLASHLTDVASSDHHTVKPWFAGKLDFVPPVVDLASNGYPLVGGRLDYLHGRTVAALVYRMRAHTVNVYIWPLDKQVGNAQDPRSTLNGYSIVRWTDSEMSYCAVSDASLANLKEFAGVLRVAVSATQKVNAQ